MKKIAFIKTNTFSNAFQHVYNGLKENYPDCEIHVFDLWQDVISKYNVRSFASCLAAYGTELVRGTKRFPQSILRTEYFYNTVRKRLVKLLSREKYVFTFQLQSIFDASVPGTPHFIYTDHTHLANTYYPSFDMDRLFSDEWVSLEKQTYENAAVIFTMSSHVKKSLTELYGCDARKTETVGCGFNVTLPDASLFNNDKYATKQILFIGKDWERKGGPLLVEAFAIVRKQIPDAKLTIVGCNVKLGVENCTVHGYVPLAEINNFYNNASLFCMPTREEPFGFAFLDAYANKLPVVSLRIGALPDIIREGETGFMVNENAEEFAGKIVYLLENPKVSRDFGEAGHNLIVPHYNWPNTLKKMSRKINEFI